MFKNYFDGEGTVKMVICVSPKSEDYDETIVSAYTSVCIYIASSDIYYYSYSLKPCVMTQ